MKISDVGIVFSLFLAGSFIGCGHRDEGLTKTPNREKAQKGAPVSRSNPARSQYLSG